MGTLLATGGSGALVVPVVWAEAALSLVAEALGVAAVSLVAEGGAGQCALVHRISTPSKTLAGQHKAYNSCSKAAIRSSHDKVLVAGVSKCITLWINICNMPCSCSSSWFALADK